MSEDFFLPQMSTETPIETSPEKPDTKEKILLLMENNDPELELRDNLSTRTDVWKFFQLIYYKNQLLDFVYCKTCKNLLSHKGRFSGTSHFRSHPCTSGKLKGDNCENGDEASHESPKRKQPKRKISPKSFKNEDLEDDSARKFAITDYLFDFVTSTNHGKCKSCEKLVRWNRLKVAQHKRSTCPSSTTEEKEFFSTGAGSVIKSRRKDVKCISETFRKRNDDSNCYICNDPLVGASSSKLTNPLGFTETPLFVTLGEFARHP